MRKQPSKQQKLYRVQQQLVYQVRQFATISDPKASFALVKKILIAVTVIIMLPTIIISSIPSSIINLISIDQTQDSTSSQVFESKYDEFLTGFQEALSDDLSEDIECREFKAKCLCINILLFHLER